MKRLTRLTRLLCAVAALLSAAWLVGPRAQELQSGSRTIAQMISVPAIDRGLLNDGNVREPRRSGDASSTDPRRVHDLPYVPGRVIVKFSNGGSATSRTSAATTVGARAITQPSWADFDIVTIDPAADPEEVARQLAHDRTCSTRSRAIAITRCSRRTIRCTAGNGTSQSIDMEQAWDINPGATEVSSSRCSTRASRTDRAGPLSRRAFRVGTTRVPGARPRRRPVRGGAGARRDASRFVAPYDFIWDDATAGRHRRARHARVGHDRPAHQQRHRGRRDGVQRADHAGQGDLERLGSDLRAARTTGPMTSWRAASGTRPTTAPT